MAAAVDTSSETVSRRRAVMGLLARANRDELELPLSVHWPALEVRSLRSPEIGLVMLRGRIGGDGAAFNVGEATVSRAVVELATGERGYGQVLGRNPETARLAAIFDALAQRADAMAQVEAAVLGPIRSRLAVADVKSRTETAATKVDFFTLVRGESQ